MPASHTDVRRSISTKFCMLIEVVLAIIAPVTVLDTISTLAARVIEHLAENTPTEVNSLYL